MTGKIDPEDWTTIWQSETAALAVDREWLEGLGRAAEAWNAALAAQPGAAGSPGPDAAARPAALGAAPGAGGLAEPGNPRVDKPRHT